MDHPARWVTVILVVAALIAFIALGRGEPGRGDVPDAGAAIVEPVA